MARERVSLGQKVATAKAFGLAIPESLLLCSDEVIE
jgi:hypothetical protein